ncbi:MAG: hypothetical protein MR531_01260 [Lachnospiraceae bacterium]|nr:hypothetical protein [Lachnospiraceae bacterium]
MNSCVLVTFISSLACAIAKTHSKEGISALATVFTQLGDTLSTILAHDDLCCSGNEESYDISENP